MNKCHRFLGHGKGKVHPCTGTEALYRPTAHRGSRGIALPFHDHGTRRGWGVSVTPRPLFTPRKDPVPIVQEAGWAPGPVGRMRKISPPPGFDPRTVQPLASRYTDWATRPILGHEARRFVNNYRCACCFVNCWDRNDRRLEFVG